MPARTVTIDLPALQLDTRCEVEKGVHKLIRDKFSDVVQKWFRQVPSNPDYYFYCPETPVVSTFISDSFQNYSLIPILILVLLNIDIPNQNSVDPDQLASSERFTLFNRQHAIPLCSMESCH